MKFLSWLGVVVYLQGFVIAASGQQRLNQPYGLFFAIDLPGKAFNKFPNSHNFYGDFRDLELNTFRLPGRPLSP